MTDEQIIIDGVDVSGCKFYLPYSEKCECIVDDNGNNNLFCREYRDCYYKRMYHTGQEKDIYKNENKELYKLLKAKEQECEDLKIYIESNEQQVKEVETLVMDNDRLINELDQLKAQLLDQEAETLKAGGIIETLTKENEQLKKQACGLRPELKYIIDKTCCKYNINAKYYHEKIIEIINNLDKYNQTLTEIKEVLQFYNNSTIGVDKGNGIFEFEVSNDNIGKLICCYDTNPAKQALQKIRDVD